MANPNIAEFGKDTQFKPGQSGNPGGRPKNTLKDYVRQKFMAMTPEEKEKWLIENKVPAEVIWKMGEGNPAQESDITSKGEKISIESTPIIDELANKLREIDGIHQGTDKSSNGTDTKSMGKEASN